MLAIPTVASYLVISMFAVCLAARDVGLAKFRLPQRRGQVKRETVLNHPVGGAILHGFALGTAFYTFIPVSLPYLVFLLPLTGLIELRTVVEIGFFFAFGRSVPVFVRMFFRNIDADRLAKELMTGGLPIARTISSGAISVVAGLMVTGALNAAAR
jgi:hypothetical protein